MTWRAADFVADFENQVNPSISDHSSDQSTGSCLTSIRQLMVSQRSD
jgi:hypothetical protein